MSRRCKEITFDKLVSLISAVNSELVFGNSYENAVRVLYELTKDLCKLRESKSVTVRVKARSMFGYYSSKWLVALDVEKSSINNMYIIVIKSISEQ